MFPRGLGSTKYVTKSDLKSNVLSSSQLKTRTDNREILKQEDPNICL